MVLETLHLGESLDLSLDLSFTGEDVQEEEGFFEIIDYTNVTQWEHFISHIEQVISKWWTGLSVNVEGNGCFRDMPRWLQERIAFGDPLSSMPTLPFALTFCWIPYHPPEDIEQYHAFISMNEKEGWQSTAGNDIKKAFASDYPLFYTKFHTRYGHYKYGPLPAGTMNQVQKIHLLHRWSGLHRLVILSPLDSAVDASLSTQQEQPETPKIQVSTESVAASSTSRAMFIDTSTNRLLTSAVMMALHTTACSLPVFIPSGSLWKSLFTGVSLGLAPSQVTPDDSLFETSDWTPLGTGQRFSMFAAPNPVGDLGSLNGMMKYFRSRMRSGQDSVPVSLATCYTYRYHHTSQDPLPLHLYSAFTFETPPVYEHSSIVGTFAIQPAIITLPVGPPFDPLVSLSLEVFYDVDYTDSSDQMVPNLFPFESKEMLNKSSKEPQVIKEDEWFTKYSKWMKSHPESSDKWRLYAEFDGLFELPAMVSDTDPRTSIVEDAVDTLLFAMPSEASQDAASKVPVPEDLTGKLMILSSMLAHFTTSWRETETNNEYFDMYYGVMVTLMKTMEGLSGEMVEQVSSDSIKHHALFARLVTDKTSASSTSQKSLSKKTSTFSFLSKDRKPSVPIPAIKNDDMASLLKFLFQPDAFQVHFRQQDLPVHQLAAVFPDGVLVPPHSLLWNVCVTLLDCISPTSTMKHPMELIPFLIQTWKLIVEEVVWCFEKGIPISNLGGEPGDPGIHFKYTLLHQKLQMINCCIQRRNQKHQNEELGVPHAAWVHSPHSVPPKSKLKELDESVDVPKDVHSDAASSVLSNGSSTSSRSLLKRVSVSNFSRRLFGQSDKVATLETHPESTEAKLDGEPSFSNLFDSVEEPSVGSSHATHESEKSNEQGKDVKSATAPVSIPMPSNKKNEAGSVPGDTVLLDETAWASYNSDKSWDDFGGREQESDAKPHQATLAPPCSSPTKMAASFDSNKEFFDPLIQPTLEHTDMGRLRKMPGITLLNTGQEAWIPITQEPGFMTEDMVREHQVTLESLGTSAQGAKERAKLQSSHLISDMQAFKAANPSAILEDFVRWHSPRDFIIQQQQGQDDTKQGKLYFNGIWGCLSPRMTRPDNLWQELWRTSEALPVSQQILLFDEEEQAERVLNYLKNQVTPYHLMQQLVPSIFMVAFHTLSSHPLTMRIDSLWQQVHELGKSMSRLQWTDITPADTHSLDTLVKQVRDIETRIGIAISLLEKFPKQYDLIQRILARSEVYVQPSEKSAIKEAFGDLLSTPVNREHIIEQSDRRLYIGIQPNDFRLFHSEPTISYS